MKMTDILLSLPGNPGLHECVKEISGSWGDIFISSDPPEKQLGSGGGTCWILAEAWRDMRDKGEGSRDFSSWLAGGPRMVIHGSGESRRLPAYAPAGKPKMHSVSIQSGIFIKGQSKRKSRSTHRMMTSRIGNFSSTLRIDSSRGSRKLILYSALILSAVIPRHSGNRRSPVIGDPIIFRFWRGF